MSVIFKLIQCEPFVNESERIATGRLEQALRKANQPWLLLSNLSISTHHSRLPDEIDLIAILADGIFVVEVKHWDLPYVKRNKERRSAEIAKLNAKAKRIKGILEKSFDPGFVAPRMLFTKGSKPFTTTNGRLEFEGVELFGIGECAQLIVPKRPGRNLTPDQIGYAAQLLAPKTKVLLRDDITEFAGLGSLKLVSREGNGFHRVYRGLHPTRRERVLLHLYDLSASPEMDPKTLAKREFEVIQHWQKSRHVPKLMDSYREAEGYSEELYYFSLMDTDAVSVAEKASDEKWSFPARLGFAIKALQALQEFHEPPDQEQSQLIHRNINPKSLRVRHDDTPLFTDFRLGRLSGSQTIGATQVDFGENAPFVAPEVRDADLHTADRRSDVFAICKTLETLFPENDRLRQEVREILQQGAIPAPEERANIPDLIESLESRLTMDSAEPPEQKPVTDIDPGYWDEDTLIELGDFRYKVLQRLGGGGLGWTFKVVEIDRENGDEYGIYVAKVIRHAADGKGALEAYRRVRAHSTGHPNLSVIYEKVAQWNARQPVALLKWIEGQPLSDYIGVLPILAEDLGEESAEDLALRWLIVLCNALVILHRVKLVHGDVTPANIILSAGMPILTDYDTVGEVGDTARAHTPVYCSPEVQKGGTLQGSDDIYSLAASFFHIFYDRQPFTFESEIRKDQGLNWPSGNDDEFTRIRPFLEKATSARREDRFADAYEAEIFLKQLATKALPSAPFPQIEERPQTLSPKNNPWLKYLLSTYPGSKWGNVETRGLDSEFAASTYVETELDRSIRREIDQSSVNLVILFGNAGDGKTAFLQHLAKGFGMNEFDSSRRVLTHRLPDGRALMINLDGSASWKGRSSNELLDQILGPFHTQSYDRNLLHIVAINSGKLLEWIESQPQETYLTRQLRQLLLDQKAQLDSGFRLIDLNQRSLVGGLDVERKTITTGFFDALVKKLLGDREDQWTVCLGCSAQNRCSAWRSVRALRDPTNGPVIRARLIEAFQACHQRGEIHITARELRAALSYILFGLNYCEDLHHNPELRAWTMGDRAFNAESPLRQGELLGELAQLDPALESDPLTDRALLKDEPGRESQRSLAMCRRTAYFNGTGTHEIKLAKGQHLSRFRRIALMDAQERQGLCRELCEGIARLEDLPHKAFGLAQVHGVPLRISPRTPVETAFWVVKPWERFELRVPHPVTVEGLEFLPIHVELIYHLNPDSHGKAVEDRLRINLELFHLLLELRKGVQLSGSGEEGIFANLSLFRQRLAQEDFGQLYAWHPSEENSIYRIRVDYMNGKRTLVREAVK